MKIRANRIDIPSRRIEAVEMEIANGIIVAISPISESCPTYILPGFIDAHIHIESSMLVPSEFARLAVCHGTVATVSDPHEIANVLGIKGVEFMLDNGGKSGFKFYFGASSCVPATPFETSGAALDAKAVAKLLADPRIRFLSEVMNFPGVIARDPEMMAKIDAARAADKPIDGHAPGLRADDLDRYLEAGISTDHEAFSYEEALEKLQKGMKILIREGSAAKNFEALHPLIGLYPQMLMFCSDDRHPDDLLRDHIDAMVRRAVAAGHDLFDVLRIACLNPITHYALNVGQLRVGDSADFIEVDNLSSFNVLTTFIRGKKVFGRGEMFLPSIPVDPLNRFEAHRKTKEDFAFSCEEQSEVIVAIDHELITHEMKAHLACFDHRAQPDVKHDILKIVVVNRYADRPPAVAFVHGFGLKRGAIASSVAHDSHNIVAVGCSDEEIARAVNLIIDQGGGISATDKKEGEVLPLEVAGIMSRHDAFTVARSYERLGRFAKETLGSTLSSPFMTLSFMALLVIPDLKLSDKGLFDGKNFRFVSELPDTPPAG